MAQIIRKKIDLAVWLLGLTLVGAAGWFAYVVLVSIHY